MQKEQDIKAAAEFHQTLREDDGEEDDYEGTSQAKNMGNKA